MSSQAVPTRLALLFSVICGVTTANAYYAQPLLDRIAQDLHASTAGVSLLVTTGQVGTALGLLFIVPAADIVRRQNLLTALFVTNTLALAGSAAAPNAPTLAVLAVFVGIGAVAIPVISAYAATLADDASRGRVLGVIMGGVLFGILMSRTVASLIAAAGGWRTVYVVAAVLMAAATVVVRATIHGDQPALQKRYLAQVGSVLAQFRRSSIMRSRCAIGACVMAAFTAFWTSVTFLLAGPPFEYSQIGIGLFALSGVAGALMASGGGRLIDRYRHWRWQSSGVALGVLAVSFGILALGRSSIVLLVLGALVMDAAIQAVHVTNQSVVYEVDQQARARIASGYMTSFAIGGVAGSYVSAQAFEATGWYGACWAGAGFAVLGLLVWLFGSGGERAAQRSLAEARLESATR
ncbi:MFS transporter [Amycolatopsis tolypomycina]|uniref:MFS transporter n=1 Tax=Amycolatopsis tolypomycina TaxID=208445 RepID=UPI0033AF866C